VTVMAEGGAGQQIEEASGSGAVSGSCSGRRQGWGRCRAQLGEASESGVATTMAEERVTVALGGRVRGR
jgi:hypothetical protein